MEKWQDPETLSLWFAIVLFFVLGLVVSIILLVRLNYRKIIERKEVESELKLNHQRALLKNSLEIQERERDRIAADLHDELIGKLTVVRLQNQVESDPKTLDSLLDESIVIARRITHDLSPPLIEHTPLEDLVNELILPWQKTMEVIYLRDIRNVFNIPPQVKIQLTRIVQEIMTNISKHSGATSVCIRLRETSRFLVLFIEDNGKGIDLSKSKRGLGLKNIESRVQYILGKYKIKSTIHKKTSFLFLLEQDKISTL